MSAAGGQATAAESGQNEPPSPGVLVVGMHRSGTSALTRVISLLGLSLCRDDDLWPGSWANESGHFESESLTRFNARLVHDELGGRWSAPPKYDAAAIAALVEGFGAEATERFSTTHPERGWVWKDPRISVLLPFWRAVLPEKTTAVLTVRHPIEVAESLHRRDGISIGFGLLSWERYQRSALQGLAGMPTFVTTFADLMGDPAGTAEQLVGFLAPRTGATLTTGTQVEIEEFLDGEARHFDHGTEDLSAHPDATEEQAALYRLCLDLAGSHDSFPVVDLPPETPGMDLAFAEHVRLADVYDQREAEHAAEHSALEGEIEFLRQECERRSEQASALAEEVMARREEVEALSASLDRIRSMPPLRAMRAVRRRLGR
jgi:hypothetical protein